MTKKRRYPEHRRAVVQPLTARRRAILSAIADSQRTRGFAPSLREISVAVRIPSHSAVLYHLSVLERTNYLAIPRLADGRMITHALHLTASGIHAAAETQPQNSNGAKQNGK